MKPIIILTKNLLAENIIQEQLQYLGYEVLCSKVILEQLLNRSSNKDITEEFKAIIFSETIANHEIREILSIFSGKNKLLIRKVSKSISKLSIKEKDDYLDLGIHMCVSVEDSLDVLREQLASQELENMTKPLDSVNKSHNTENVVELFIKRLPKNERKFFNLLKSNENTAVTREHLCNFVWNGEATHSRLVQCSALVKRINNRAKKYGMQEEIIKTIWGRGYQLQVKK